MTIQLGLIHVIFIIIPNIFKAFLGIKHRIFTPQRKNFSKNTVFQ
jgi:hypothetical protein